MTSNVCIVYQSGYGHTARLSAAVADGVATEAGVGCRQIPVERLHDPDAMAQSNLDQGADAVPPEADLETGRALGRRVAACVRRWKQ